MGKSSLRVRKSVPRTRRKVKKTGRKRTRKSVTRKHRRTRTRRRRYKGGAEGSSENLKTKSIDAAKQAAHKVAGKVRKGTKMWFDEKGNPTKIGKSGKQFYIPEKGIAKW